MNEVPLELWTAAPLAGRNLTGSSLAELFGDRVELLLFVRHLG
jgi:hypothetical protein